MCTGNSWEAHAAQHLFLPESEVAGRGDVQPPPAGGAQDHQFPGLSLSQILFLAQEFSTVWLQIRIQLGSPGNCHVLTAPQTN